MGDSFSQFVVNETIKTTSACRSSGGLSLGIYNQEGIMLCKVTL